VQQDRATTAFVARAGQTLLWMGLCLQSCKLRSHAHGIIYHCLIITDQAAESASAVFVRGTKRTACLIAVQLIASDAALSPV
jgi:hypothetical protein